MTEMLIIIIVNPFRKIIGNKTGFAGYKQLPAVNTKVVVSASREPRKLKPFSLYGKLVCMKVSD